VRHAGEDQPLEVGERLGQRLGLRGRSGGKRDAQFSGAGARQDGEGLGVGKVPGDPVDQPMPFAAKVF
jgi:hypothetical protein